MRAASPGARRRAKGMVRATNHWAQISFPRIPCQCISQKQIFRFPIIKAMNCTIDWFLLPLTLFRPDLPRPHPAHLHKESFKDVCTTYKQTHTFSKSKLCTATYIPFLDGVASDPPTIQLTQDTAWVKCAREMWINNRNQVRKSWHLKREWSTRKNHPVCVLLIWRPISLWV